MARAIESTHGKLVATTTVNGWYEIFTHWSIGGEYKNIGEVEKDGRVWRTQGIAFATLEKAAQFLANGYFSAPAPVEIEAQEQDEIAAETVAAEQTQAPAESVQFDHVTATKEGRFYDIFERETGANLGFVETCNGVFYTYGHAFATLEKAAKFLAKQVLAAIQTEYENGQALSDLQAQTECEAYCAREYEQEQEREQATRQMHEQMPVYTPKKIILGLPDGTAKIIHNTGETELIPARKVCRVCGGEAKDSTALVHDFFNEPPSVVFGQDKLATRRAVCLKCKECGHSWQEGKQKESQAEN